MRGAGMYGPVPSAQRAITPPWVPAEVPNPFFYLSFRASAPWAGGRGT
jgi:hypothetical protein